MVLLYPILQGNWKGDILVSLCPSVCPYYWKINCIIRRSIDRLEDQLYYSKINRVVERSVVLLEDIKYWRQFSRIGGNYWPKTITARRWLHKYVGAECGASSFTGYNIKYAIQMSIQTSWIPVILHILSTNFRRLCRMNLFCIIKI